jgi:hypothetical protein
MKIWIVRVLRRDSWLKRLHGTGTTMGLKVLNITVFYLIFVSVGIYHIYFLPVFFSQKCIWFIQTRTEVLTVETIGIHCAGM